MPWRNNFDAKIMQEFFIKVGGKRNTIQVSLDVLNVANLINKNWGIADFYNQEVDTAVKGLTSMIEPLIMVIMGFVIGAIVISMFMPMFSMGELAGKDA